ncbi:MAG: fumarylacetoacetate hydrolase family protein [Actinobacteria bacterium]|nr:fumarylacetoacetate hydrolase family protein [Actinomycetota bacterium]
MRWVSFATAADPQVERVGVAIEEEIVALPAGTTLLGLLRAEGDLRAAGEAALAARHEVQEPAAVRLLPPIPEPPSVRDFMAFEQHVASAARHYGREVAEAWYRMPVFYFSNPASMFGARDPVGIPADSERFDFELEVGCVIGREGRDVAAADAMDHVAGFTIFCDWSARDLQLDEMTVGLGPAKGKDSATTLGPFMVSPEELEDVQSPKGYDLRMSAFLNGRELGSDRWSNVHFSFPEMIERASRGTRLRPGDILGSGTCGYGCLSELRRSDDQLGWLAPGDVVRLEIERLGSVESRITSG